MTSHNSVIQGGVHDRYVRLWFFSTRAPVCQRLNAEYSYFRGVWGRLKQAHVGTLKRLSNRAGIFSKVWRTCL